MRKYKALAKTVTAALAAKSLSEAEAALASVKAEWDKAALPQTEILQPAQRELGELEMEVGGARACARGHSGWS